MNAKLKEFIKNINTSTISEDRKKILDNLTLILQSKINNNEPININFICTHNSRRSHLSQIWMQTIASYFKQQIFCYSGGTEATSVAPQVINTLSNQGFNINQLSIDKNPIYTVKFNSNSLPITVFSKLYSHSFNPSSKFTAIMTCSQADGGCPFVAGADSRVSITYEDPKNFDGTDLEKSKYLERSIQIATEMYYILNSLK